jgi:hypothetical protein
MTFVRLRRPKLFRETDRLLRSRSMLKSDVRALPNGDRRPAGMFLSLCVRKGLGDMPILALRPLVITGEQSYSIPDCD